VIELIRNARTLLKFTEQFPVYNWQYPVKGQDLGTFSYLPVYEDLDAAETKQRAFYFHVPFCETICTFCTLSRGIGREGDREIERYTQALIREIQLKSKLEWVSAVPPTAIWFGGGTPSTLSADQLRRILTAIRSYFDLSRLTEFTFELEVKSVTEEKCAVMSELGVNKVRFGLQTTDPLYRKLFNITATLDQTYAVAALLGRYFPWRSFDIIYGMHGQSYEGLSRDLNNAVAIGTETIDCYPMNHLATQSSLHSGYAAAGLSPLSYLDKMAMTSYVNRFLRAASFRIYNGHGYVRLLDPTDETPGGYTRRYRNEYNTLSFASHWDDDLVAFGSSGLSQSGAWSIMNDPNRASYTANLLDSDALQVRAAKAERVPYERGLVVRLPYEGVIDKGRVPWDRINPAVVQKLGHLIEEGLLVESTDQLQVTELGWLWYVNMIYYLSSERDQRILDQLVKVRGRNSGLTDGERRMLPISPVTR
jgi:oxygen-independent coproporphyrinogen-3 oxidase